MRYILTLLLLPLLTTALAQTPKLEIHPLTGNFYIYITYGTYKGEPVPANGMYLVTNDGVVLFDTPWDTTQFQPLLDTITARHHKKVTTCIATHFHEDRTAGLEYYTHAGINTYTTKMTDSISKEKGYKSAGHLMTGDTTFTIGGTTFQVYYPGKGHAPDNIIIWFPTEKILYGGCLIKSTEDNTLGYLGDASPADYATTIQHVITHCPHPRYIIPGHNSWRSTKSLKHTLRMARRL